MIEWRVMVSTHRDAMAMKAMPWNYFVRHGRNTIDPRNVMEKSMERRIKVHGPP